MCLGIAHSEWYVVVSGCSDRRHSSCIPEQANRADALYWAADHRRNTSSKKTTPGVFVKEPIPNHWNNLKIPDVTELKTKTRWWELLIHQLKHLIILIYVACMNNVICNTWQHPSSLCAMKRQKASSNPDTTSTVEAKSRAVQKHAASSRVRVTLHQLRSSCFCFLREQHLRQSPTSLSPAGLPAALPPSTTSSAAGARPQKLIHR